MLLVVGSVKLLSAVDRYMFLAIQQAMMEPPPLYMVFTSDFSAGTGLAAGFMFWLASRRSLI